MEPLGNLHGKACVVGSGPNGLAACRVLAQAGLQVDVFEAEATPGGAVRTMELTLPGFRHDFGSAVYPLGAGSPFFSSLPLADHGLEWMYSPAPLAHPLDDGTAVVLEHNLDEAARALGDDGKAWRNLLQPFVERWNEFAPEVLRPIPMIPKHPFLMARFGMTALLSAKRIASRFRSERTRALFAGLAAHSFLALDEVLSGAFGMLMAIPAHAVGWPVPRGGAQAIPDALCSYLATFGGAVWTSRRVESLAELKDYELILCDVTPRQLLKMSGERLSQSYLHELERFRYGPAAFKVDYALSAPIPWKASDCLRAATVHLVGTFEEIATSEKALRSGKHADGPFVLLAQPSLFDSSRAPEGRHTAWAYCHVPNGSVIDMTEQIEKQVERFAPGFRDLVIGRHVMNTVQMEEYDPNYIGGDITGGMMSVQQLFTRPALRSSPYK